MKNMRFSNLKIGQKFSIDGVPYVKTGESSPTGSKLSQCKDNCTNLNDGSYKVCGGGLIVEVVEDETNKK